MPFAPLYMLLREVAIRETRSAVVAPDSDLGLPAGEYGFLEMFCDGPGCDCRRVLFEVIRRGGQGIEAVVNYGWEDREFYVNWLHDHDPKTAAILQGPSLNIGSPQSRLAPAILRLARDVWLQDADYVDRIKRHYRMFRAKIDASAPGETRR